MIIDTKDAQTEDPRGLTEAVVFLVPKFYENYPKPLWIQVDTLGAGDVLVVKSETTYYYVFVVGSRVGLLFTSKLTDPPVEIHIYGGYDLVGSQPAWGKIQVGLPFLFASSSNPDDATKTSPVEAMYLRKALRTTTPLGKVPAMTPNMVGVKAKAPQPPHLALKPVVVRTTANPIPGVRSKGI